jgi:SPP1 gp7 family putative phage head morphogenesis protein
VNPFDDNFWLQELRNLFGVLISHLRSALLGGIAGGAAQIDYIPSQTDEQIEGFIRQYAFTAAAGITETSRKFAIAQMIEWQQGRETQQQLIERLAPMFGENRARMIAVTETTRAYAEGNIAAWQDSGFVKGKRWMTTKDDIVCPICSPLDGMVVELDSNGFTTAVDGFGLTAPPAHVSCRCWLQPFVEEL